MPEGLGPPPQRIALRRHLRPAIDADGGVSLIGENGVVDLPGAEAAVVVPLLDGTRDLAELCRAAATRISAVAVGRTVGMLMRAGLAGYVADPAEPVAPSADARFWDLAGADGGAASQRLAATGVELVSVGGAPTDELAAALRLAGLQPTAAPACREPAKEQAPLVVVVTTDYLLPELSALARAAAEAGRRWFPVCLHRSAAWLGPFVGPDPADACWACVTHRLRSNRLRSTGSAELAGLQPPAAGSALTESIGARQVALLLAKAVLGLPVPTAEVVVHDLAPAAAPIVSRHPTPRRPHCAGCGDPGLVGRQVMAPFRIESRPKLPAPDGAPTTAGARTRTAAETLEACRDLVDPVTGIVPELRRDPGAPPGMHVYVSGLNVATTAASSAGRRALRHLCGGKGMTDADAKAGALCEALERYSGQLHGDEPRRTARFVDLDDALDPRDLMLFDESQYQLAAAPAPAGGAPGYDRVPEPFDPSAEIDWTPVWSLTAQRHRLLPTAMLYYDIDGVSRGGRFVVADSNGNAAGGCRAEAVVQGFLELVERDAVAIWWYNRTRQRGVELADCGDRWLRDQHAAHGQLGRQLVALDLSTELGVPVVAAVSRRGDRQGSADVCFGFGAHVDPVTATRRAVAEVNQLISAALPGDGRYATDDPALVSWWQTVTPETDPYLLPDPDRPALDPAEIDTSRFTPLRATDDIADDVAAVVELCRRHRLELLVLDQTRPDVDLAVVKVLVPGLRHFWRRLAPGRLYDVPVALGRIPSPLSRDQLNPRPMFL